MISLSDALAMVSEHAEACGTKTLPLSQALGHVLAQAVTSPFDMPLFDNSAVDGYGVRIADVADADSAHPVALDLRGTVQAGDAPSDALAAGATIKILTGAPIPPGVEAVVMQEYTETTGQKVHFLRTAQLGENIRRRGEELHQGDIVLEAGHRITPPVVGLLGTLGYTDILVFRPPKVAVLVTGNELVQPGENLKPGQIYESNSYSLVSALTSLGITDYTVHYAQDDKASLRAAVADVLETADIVLSTGGVSVGEFDLVKEVFVACGVQPRFWGVAIKPGKPVFFGHYQQDPLVPKKLVFGLPGNPVAVLLTFYLLVKPALMKMMGQAPPPPLTLKAKLTRPLRKKPGREEFVRGILQTASDGHLTVIPTVGQGSHMLTGIAKANCLIDFPLEQDSLAAGEWVAVQLLNWSDA